MLSAALVMFSYPFVFVLERGTADLYALFFVTLAFLLWRGGRSPLLVGLCIAIAIHLKIYPLIFIYYFFIKREWRICASICACALLVVLGTALASLEGFGGGIVLNKTLIIGDSSCGAEVHNSLNKFNPDWNAEESVSTRAIQRVYAGKAQLPFKEDLMPKEIAEIARGIKPGDQWAAHQAFTQFGEALGSAIANILTLMKKIHDRVLSARKYRNEAFTPPHSDWSLGINDQCFTGPLAADHV